MSNFQANLLRASASPRESLLFIMRSREAAKIMTLGLALCSAPAFAQDAADAEREVLEGPDSSDFEAVAKRIEPIVVTATGAEQSSARVPTVIKVQYDNTLHEFSQVADGLATIVGVNVTRNGGVGGLSAVRIRGAEGDQTLVLIDGVRVNDPASTGGAFDFGNLLSGNIERVELLRGPNSVPWGSQAIGGVINIVQAPATSDWQATARAEYGTNEARQIVGNVSGTTGILGLSFGGGAFKEDGISAFKDGTEADGFRQYAANGRALVRFSDNIELDLRGYYVDGKTQIDGFPPPFYSFADTPEFSTYSQAIGYAGGNVRLFDGKTEKPVGLYDLRHQPRQFRWAGTGNTQLPRARTNRAF